MEGYNLQINILPVTFKQCLNKHLPATHQHEALFGNNHIPNGQHDLVPIPPLPHSLLPSRDAKNMAKDIRAAILEVLVKYTTSKGS